VGFDWGEYNNISMSWLLARNKYLKDSGKSWKSLGQTDYDKIQANARQYALNMTESGQLGYQKGAFSLTTQFMSIQQKALLAVLPKKWGGSKAFTSAEKRRIALAQVVMYGTTGWSMHKLWEYIRDKNGIEVNEEVDRIVTGGLVDYATNKIVEGMLGEDTDIVLSKDVAPISGLHDTVTNLVTNLMTQSPEGIIAGAAGASGTAASRWYKAADSVANIMVASGLDTPEKLERSLHAMNTIWGGYSNYMKFAAIRNLGYAVDSHGKPVMEATFAEGIARLFGLSTQSEIDYYNMLQTQFGRFSPQDDSGKAEALRADAQKYYDRLTAAVTLYTTEVPEGLDELHEKRLIEAIKTESTILNAYDPADRDYVLVQFRRILSENLGTKKDKLVSGIVKAAFSGQYGSDTEYVINKLLNSGLIGEDERDVYKESLDFIMSPYKEQE
jgi:hypothetical protein